MKPISSITFIHNGFAESVNVSDGYEISQQSQDLGEQSLHPCPCYYATHTSDAQPDFIISEMAILTISHEIKQ